MPKVEKTRQRSTRKIEPNEALHEYVVDLIDEQFAKVLTFYEDGYRVNRTAFQEIFRLIWHREMLGLGKAIVVRKAYEKFARDEAPKKERKVIVVKGDAQ